MAISMITVITLSGDREEQRETNKMVQAAARHCATFYDHFEANPHAN